MPISYDKAKKRWRFKFERVIEGKRYRVAKVLPAGFSREQAQEYDKEETAKLYESASGKRQHTIADAILLYCKEKAPQNKAGEEVIRLFQMHYDEYVGKLIDEFPTVAARIKSLPLNPGTIKVRISYIRSALNYAHKYHGFPQPPQIPTIKVNNERHSYLSRKEMLQIASKTHTIAAQAIIRIAFYSGLRWSEILRSKVINGMLVVTETKNGNPIHAVPIHRRITSAVKRLPLNQSPNQLKWQWRQARKAAGLEHYRFHDLRHSAASEMINAGVDLYTVGKVLNHRDMTSTKRYAHLQNEMLEKAIAMIGK